MERLRTLIIAFFVAWSSPVFCQTRDQGDIALPGAAGEAVAGSGFSLPLAVGYVDGPRLMRLLGNSGQDVQAFNRQLRPLVEAAKPMLILQDVVWISHRLNVTESIARLAGKQGEDSVLEIPRMTQGARPTRFAVLDPKRLAEGGGQEPMTKERRKELAANLEVYARRKGIDIVLADYGFASSDLDITGSVILFDKDGPVIGDKGAMTYLKTGWISVSRIFRESPMALQATRLLQAEFQERDRELHDLAERSATDSDARSLFGTKKASFDRDLKRRRDEENAKIIAKANRQVRMLAEAGGYNIIFQELVWGAPELDITQAIIVGMGEGD